MDDAVAHFCSASQSNDVDGMISTCAPDVELISPLSGRMVFRGHHDLHVLLRTVYSTLRDVRWGAPIGEGVVCAAISEATLLGVRMSDGMIFELAEDGLIRRIRPHVRPWLGLTVFALIIGPKMAGHADVVWRALRAGPPVRAV